MISWLGWASVNGVYFQACLFGVVLVFRTTVIDAFPWPIYPLGVLEFWTLHAQRFCRFIFEAFSFSSWKFLFSDQKDRCFFFRTCLRRTGPDVRVTFSRLTACFRSHLRGWCYSGVGPSFHPLPSLPPPSLPNPPLIYYPPTFAWGFKRGYFSSRIYYVKLV